MTELVGADRVDRRLRERLQVVREWHAINAAGIPKAPHVIRDTKDGRATGSRVAADTLEDARCVMNPVTHHVDGRVVPCDELAVAPNLCRAAGCGFSHGFPEASYTGVSDAK